jgi:EmrB/QacA subfamily drug resistance transporter
MTTLPNSEKWLLAGTILAASMVFIDGSALNVALPVVQSDLHATASDLVWIVNGYLLVLAALIPIGGALGDRFGRRRVYMVGIGLFSAGSLLCGLAPSTDFLIAARVFQGFGGALLVPGSLALLSAGTAQERRGRAIGVWSAATTIVTVIGPLLGGVFSDLGQWRLVFLINPPLGLATLVLLGTRLPADAPSKPQGRLDVLGSLLLAAGLGALAWGAQAAPDWGFTDPVPWTAIALGAVGVIGFVVVELRVSAPILPARLFQSPTFAGANLLTFFLYGALSVMAFFLSLNLVQVQGYPKTLAGMSLLPFAACMAFLSRPMGQWADRIGPRPFLTIGPILVAAGFLLLAGVGTTDGWTAYLWTFFPGILAFGLGMAVTVAPLSAAVMGSAGDELSGTASGVNNAVSRIAGVLCLAVLGAVAVTLFPPAWNAGTAGLNLTHDQRSFLAAEAVRLAGADLPKDLDAGVAAQVHEALRTAFVATWRVVIASCAALSLAAAAAGWLLVRPLSRGR